MTKPVVLFLVTMLSVPLCARGFTGGISCQRLSSPLPLRFMDNLQTEMLEIEFLSYSKGMPTISEEDFARILLRYTTVADIGGYLENIRHCIPDEKVCYFSPRFSQSP